MKGYLYAYVDVDESGNLTDGQSGYNILPTKQYDHFFFLEKEVNLMNCKVEYDGSTPKLVETGKSND